MKNIEIIGLKQCVDYTPDASEKTVVDELFRNVVFRASRILLLPFKIELISSTNHYTLAPPFGPSFFTLSYHIFYFVTRRRARSSWLRA